MNIRRRVDLGGHGRALSSGKARCKRAYEKSAWAGEGRGEGSESGAKGSSVAIKLISAVSYTGRAACLCLDPY